MITIDLNTISILFALIVQTGAGIWWASNITARIRHLETQQNAQGGLNSRMASIEANIQALAVTMDRLYKIIEHKADKQ